MRLEALWVISMRSPSVANITVCSPTMSPARTVAKPISLSVRGPHWPTRSNTPYSLSGRARASAITSPILSAVPEGASTLWRWWDSITSMS